MKLLDCCKSISDGDWIESEDQSSSGIRLIQTGNIGVTQYLDKQERAKYISAETFNRLKCSPVVGGDVLVSRLPDPIGRACIVPYDIGPAITAVDCSIIRVNTDIVDPKYLVYFTDSDSYKSQIASYSTGTTRKRISRKNLEKISISVPSKDKQIQIIDNLDKINFLINSLWNCLLLFDDLIRSRFIEMFGDPISYEDVNELPMLGDACKLKAGVFVKASDISNAPEKELYPCYGGNGLRGYVSTYTNDGSFPIIGRQGALCGNVRLVEGKFHATEHAVVVDLNGKYNTKWFAQYLNLLDLNRHATGAAQPGLSVGKIGLLHLKIAERKRQDEYSILVDQINKSKLAIQKSIDELEILKKSLMQEYFG